MRRSIGVTLSAGVTVAGALLCLLFAGFMILIGLVHATQPGTTSVTRVGIVLNVVVLGGLCAWGMTTAIGLFRLRAWSRWSILIFSGLLVFFGGFACLMLALISLPPTPGAGESTMRAVKTGMAAFYLVLASVGGGWLYFFNRSSVKAQFAPGGAGVVEAAGAARPLSILVIGVLFLVGAAGLFLLVVLPLPYPVAVLGIVLRGWAARVFCLGLGCAQLWTGWGLLRLKPPSRPAAIGLLVFGLCNSVAMAAVPGVWQEITTSMASWIPREQMLTGYDPFRGAWFSVGIGAVLTAVAIWLLIRQREPFVRASR